MRRGFDREQIATVMAAKGKLRLLDALHCRVRYFVDGAVLGSREFVNSIFAAERHRFGSNRKTGARSMRALNFPILTTMRDLRVNAVG